jgi:hypothetical protein
MNVDPKVDRVGGTASLLFGLVCLLFGYADWQGHQSIWKVWVVMFVLLVLNGVGMFIHASHTSASRSTNS